MSVWKFYMFTLSQPIALNESALRIHKCNIIMIFPKCFNNTDKTSSKYQNVIHILFFCILLRCLIEWC